MADFLDNMTEDIREVFERTLRDSFVQEAIALKAGLDKREVWRYVAEITSDAFIGRAAMRVGPEAAGEIAAIAEEMRA